MVRGLALIMALYAAGELFAAVLNLPIPGSVLGMILMAVGLGSGAIKVAWVDTAASGLLDNLSLFFVPAGVGLMAYGAILAEQWLVLAVAVVFSTLVVLVGTGLVYRRLSRRARSGDNG